jgi:hypothetical protein
MTNCRDPEQLNISNYSCLTMKCLIIRYDLKMRNLEYYIGLPKYSYALYIYMSLDIVWIVKSGKLNELDM